MSVVAIGCVGIPRGLLYYEYFPLWKAFLERLGVRVWVTGETARATLDAGTSLAVDEACLPVKAYIGHCVEAASRCDWILVPRVVSVEHGAYTCPKMLGLPEMVTAACRGVRVLSPVADASTGRSAGLAAALTAARALGVGAARATAAYATACLEQRAFERARVRAAGWFSRAGAGGASPRGRPRVLVLGHSYVVNDDGISLGLRWHLERMGVTPIAPESVGCREAARRTRRLAKPLFWTYEKRLYGSAVAHMEAGACNGVVQVMSFGCGPDSLVAELIRREASRRGVPYMAVTIDEHTGEAGVVTRLEAFVDMLSRRQGHR